jgi:hypothetical protein
VNAYGDVGCVATVPHFVGRRAATKTTNNPKHNSYTRYIRTNHHRLRCNS